MRSRSGVMRGVDRGRGLVRAPRPLALRFASGS